MTTNDIFVILYPNSNQIREGNHVRMGILWSGQGRPLSIRLFTVLYLIFRAGQYLIIVS